MNGTPWKDMGPRSWWFVDGLYLFAPEYRSDSEGRWMLRLERTGWDKGVAAKDLADLWLTFLGWRLTGKLERIPKDG